MDSLAPAPRPRAAIYCRVSTAEQGEHGYSLEAQVRDCRKLAGEVGAEVIGEFRDVDSGASWDLPGLNAMLDAAKRGELDLLICYDPDRLARGMAKQLVIEEELKRCGVSIKWVTLRIGDSAEDQLLKNVRASIAEYERSKIALRTARGRRAKAEQGLVVGNGWAPYGYRFTRGATGRIVGLEPDSDAAPIVRRIFEEIAETPVNKLCARLNEEGVPTMFGARWQNSTILGMVANPVYRGRAAYGKRGSNRRHEESTWTYVAVPALIGAETYRQATGALERRKSTRPARNPERRAAYPLRGLLSCGYCGGLLACITSGQLRVRYYQCLRNHPARAERDGKPVCPLPDVLGRAVEDDVWGRVAATLLDPEYLARGLAAARTQHQEASWRQRERVEALDREVDRLRGRLRRITAERLDAPTGSETETALKALAADAEGAIGRLLAERAGLQALPTPGLTPDDVDQLSAFAAEIGAGIDAAGSADRRRVYELLRLSGRVTTGGEDAVKLGRRHRFLIDWTAVIELRNTGREYKKVRLRYFTPEIEAWEARYLRVPSGVY